MEPIQAGGFNLATRASASQGTKMPDVTEINQLALDTSRPLAAEAVQRRSVDARPI